MPRLMSVALTEQAVRDRRKTVTRRLGWWEDKHGRFLVKRGDRLTLCRKVMGRKAGEPLVRICNVEVVSVSRVVLSHITADEVLSEGFEHGNPGEFVAMFAREMRCKPNAYVTRIEWRYLPDPEAGAS